MISAEWWFAGILTVASLFTAAYTLAANKTLRDRITELNVMLYAGFPQHFDAVSALIHKNAVEKGFWKGNRNKGEALALIHSEVSECLEAIRADPPDTANELEELADVVIRVSDYVVGYHPDASLGDVITTKIRNNLKRPRKHGKLF